MGGSIFAKLWIFLFPYAPRKEISTYIWLKCMVNVGIPYIHGAYGVWLPSHFLQDVWGNRPPCTLPEKKNWRLMVGRRYFSFLEGGLFWEQTRCFQGVEVWEFTPAHWKVHLKSKETIKVLSREVWSEEFRRWNCLEKAFGSKICPLFYKFMILTKKNYVDGCIKPCKKEWYEVPVNWYRISTINSINKKNCSKVGALSETLVTNATSVLTCSHGCTSRTEE